MTYSRAESQVRALLRPHIRDALALTRTASDALRAQASHLDAVDDPRPYQRVLAILCGRLADDLHVIHDVAAYGHGTQAMTLGATVFEVAYSVGYVAASDDHAIKWLGHTDFGHPPWLTKSAMQETVRRAFPSSNRSVEREQTRYRMLCMAKHGNPNLQSKLPVIVTPESFVVESDPEVSALAVQMVRAAIWLSVEPVLMALWVLQREHFLSGPALKALPKIERQFAILDNQLTGK